MLGIESVIVFLIVGAVAGWLAGQWRPLADADRPLVAAALEGLLVAATGRALKSRPFLDEVLGRRPPA